MPTPPQPLAESANATSLPDKSPPLDNAGPRQQASDETRVAVGHRRRASTATNGQVNREAGNRALPFRGTRGINLARLRREAGDATESALTKKGSWFKSAHRYLCEKCETEVRITNEDKIRLFNQAVEKVKKNQSA